MARHAAPSNGSPARTFALIAFVLVLLIAIALIAFAAVSSGVANEPWHPPLLTDEQWSLFHKGPRP